MAVALQLLPTLFLCIAVLCISGGAPKWVAAVLAFLALILLLAPRLLLH